MANTAKTIAVLTAAGLALLLHPAGAGAQTASDVDCKKCVDRGDIAKKAVVARTIKKGAVTRNKIAEGGVGATALTEGAVTADKIQSGAVTEAAIPGGAVTTVKIAPGAVGADDIADGAVTAGNLATGAVDSDKLAPGAVTNDRLADAGITEAKIAARSILSEKLAPGVLAAAMGQQLLRTIVIGPLSGGTDTCDDLIGVLDRITDAGASNPYLIKLEPGIYDCGTDQVTMKPFVDIEGSGEEATVLRGSGDGVVSVVRVPANTELRFLKVENTNNGTDAIAIRCDAGARMSHVTAQATNGVGAAFGVLITGTAVLRHVTAVADGVAFASGILNSADGTQLIHVTASATGTPFSRSAVVIQSAGTTVIRNSVLSSDPAIAANDGEIVHLAATQLDGGRESTGTFNCVAAYDGAFAALDSSCNPAP